MAILKVKDSKETIEVRNIFCVGKNYVDHIKEFDIPEKTAEISKEPVIFLKPTSAIPNEPGIVKIPELDGKKISDNLQNEVEMVIVIGKDGTAIPESEAFNHIFGYAVGIDFTLRDIQAEEKKKGLPWTTAKGFLTSAAVSEITKKEEVLNPETLNITLKINDDLKQNSNTSLMIFKVKFIIHYISSIFGLQKGDLIFTGTPAGITKLNAGDIVEAEIEEIGNLKIKVRL